jgi:hypothetical protein
LYVGFAPTTGSGGEAGVAARNLVGPVKPGR